MIAVISCCAAEENELFQMITVQIIIHRRCFSLIDKKRLVSRFLRYISCPSESLREGDFCRFLEREMKEMGYKPIREEVGEKFGSDGFNLFTRVEGSRNLPPILLCAHLDTVSPGTGIEPVIGGRAYSRKKHHSCVR